MMDEDKIWMKALLRDIYFVQTIKSTHYCEIVTRCGNGKLHADITPLYRELPVYFYKVRSSTLVNLTLIQKVDTDNRLLYFEKDIFCSYAERVTGDLKRMLRLKSYRQTGRERV